MACAGQDGFYGLSTRQLTIDKLTEITCETSQGHDVEQLADHMKQLNVNDRAPLKPLAQDQS